MRYYNKTTILILLIPQTIKVWTVIIAKTNSNLKMNLGQIISTERKSRGFSQELLAENSGISLRTIQRIENNTSHPRPHTLKTIADVLQIEPAELAEKQHMNSEPETNLKSLSKINLINSSALIGLVIPFFNIIAPIIIWSINKSDAFVKEKGKKVISFQILWGIGVTLILSTTHIIYYLIMGKFMWGRLPIAMIIFALMVLTNVFLIIRTSTQLKKGNTEIYSFIPSLF